jgi:ethanolamine kinase
MMEFTISHDNLFEDAMKVLKHFFTAWHESEVQLDQCKDGITNKLVLATHGPSGEKVLIRSYGRRSEVIIDRNQEIINLVRLSELGLSPPLYGRFHNGLIYGYIPGHVLAADQMWDQKMQQLVAERLARWHQVSVPGKRVPKLFPTLDKWLKEVPKAYSRPELQEKFNEHFDVAVITKEIEALRQKNRGIRGTGGVLP